MIATKKHRKKDIITIREAKIKDSIKITELAKEFMHYHDETIIKNNPLMKPYLDKRKDHSAIFRKFLEKNIRSRNAVVFIAESDGNAAGYSLNYIKNNIPIFKMEKIGYISDLFVKKEYRSKGISTRFKDAAMQWFKSKKIRYISLCVYNDNEFAHSVYKRWGFIDYHVEMRKKI
jgi:ribosomal protein S18 acetylase RimI-like enzyme